MFRTLDKLRLIMFWKRIDGLTRGTWLKVSDNDGKERMICIEFSCNSKLRTFDITHVEWVSEEDGWELHKDGDYYRAGTYYRKKDIYNELDDITIQKIRMRIQHLLREAAEIYGVRDYGRAWHDLEG